MSLTCPECHKINWCCSDSDIKEQVIIDLVNDIYQCYFCGHKFDEQDSLDYEWNMLVMGWADQLTPEMCLDWIELHGKEKSEFEIQSNAGEYAFTQAFYVHFGKSRRDFDKEDIIRSRRNIKLENIL
jgi:hypothetical protein